MDRIRNEYIIGIVRVRGKAGTVWKCREERVPALEKDVEDMHGVGVTEKEAGDSGQIKVDEMLWRTPDREVRRNRIYTLKLPLLNAASARCTAAHSSRTAGSAQKLWAAMADRKTYLLCQTALKCL